MDTGLWIWNPTTTTTKTKEDGVRGPWRLRPFLFVLLGNVPGHIFWFNPYHNDKVAILFDNKDQVCWLARLLDELETRHVNCVWSPPPSPPPPLVENTDIETMSDVQAENINDDNNNGDNNALLSVLTTESGTMNSKTIRRSRVVFRSFCWE